VKQPEEGKVEEAPAKKRRSSASWRRGASRRKRLLELHGEQLVPSGGYPGEPLDLARLTHCLMALAERERTVIVLSFYADRDADAIGVELGLNPGNVRVVRHRALSRLRFCMDGAS
jgi:RNA polymerase sigma-70 factor (ECF subfamily)